MRRHLVGLTLLLAFAGAANAQTALGTYTATPPGGKPLTLVLKKEANGKIGGSLSGNGASYIVHGDAQGDDVMGTLSGDGLRSYFEAARVGNTLRVIVADFGANGKPDYARAREFTMTASSAIDAPVTPAGSAAASSTAGNPFAAGNASKPDKFAGTFASTEVTLALDRRGAEYAGTIKYRGTEYPAVAKRTGETLTGTFTAAGRSYDMSIASVGDGKFVNFTTAGTTYLLARGTAAGNPLAAAAPTASTSMSALAKTAQDQQIVTLLLSTAWCSFSFSGSSTYSGTSSGTTRTSRAVFRADGTVTEGSNAESTNSGSAGSVYGSSNNGQSGKWRIENGMLMLSADGVQWSPQTLKIADNGSGAPIVTAGGKEYMRCK